jgi:hypothetical protein
MRRLARGRTLHPQRAVRHGDIAAETMDAEAHDSFREFVENRSSSLLKPGWPGASPFHPA